MKALLVFKLIVLQRQVRRGGKLSSLPIVTGKLESLPPREKRHGKFAQIHTQRCRFS